MNPCTGSLIILEEYSFFSNYIEIFALQVKKNIEISKPFALGTYYEGNKRKIAYDY